MVAGTLDLGLTHGIKMEEKATSKHEVSASTEASDAGLQSAERQASVRPVVALSGSAEPASTRPTLAPDA
jgi:hypothetical protein